MVWDVRFPESDKYAVEMADITLLVRVAPVYLNCSDCLDRYVESFVDNCPECRPQAPIELAS